MEPIPIPLTKRKWARHVLQFVIVGAVAGSILGFLFNSVAVVVVLESIAAGASLVQLVEIVVEAMFAGAGAALAGAVSLGVIRP